MATSSDDDVILNDVERGKFSTGINWKTKQNEKHTNSAFLKLNKTHVLIRP